MDLWSNNPEERLSAARALSDKDRKQIQSHLSSNSPMKPWPFGMPTPINPYIVILGPSPGGSPNPSHDISAGPKPYKIPTIAKSHDGFYYQDTKGYWDKIRELCSSFIKHFSPNLNTEECYALSGNLNLGVGMIGAATEGTVEKDYAKWIPNILVSELKPRFVVLVGLKAILKNANVVDWIASTGDLQINWKRPENEFQFMGYQTKRLVYRVWKVKKADGKEMIITMWPQHPSRSPFTNYELWQKSIQEGINYLKVL